MMRDPRDTSAEEPDGGNLHVRFRRGPGPGNRPGLLYKTLAAVIALLLVTLGGITPALPCSGFTAHDGQTVLAGQNEDLLDRRSRRRRA